MSVKFINDHDMLLTPDEAKDIAELRLQITHLDRRLEHVFIGPIPITSGDSDEVLGHLVQGANMAWDFLPAVDFQPVPSPFIRTELPANECPA